MFATLLCLSLIRLVVLWRLSHYNICDQLWCLSPIGFVAVSIIQKGWILWNVDGDDNIESVDTVDGDDNIESVDTVDGDNIIESVDIVDELMKD